MLFLKGPLQHLVAFSKLNPGFLHHFHLQFESELSGFSLVSSPTTFQWMIHFRSQVQLHFSHHLPSAWMSHLSVGQKICLQKLSQCICRITLACIAFLPSSMSWITYHLPIHHQTQGIYCLVLYFLHSCLTFSVIRISSAIISYSLVQIFRAG